jgi:hypothetical protein
MALHVTCGSAAIWSLSEEQQTSVISPTGATDPLADVQRPPQNVCFEGQADIDAPLLTNLDERVRVLVQSQRFSA